MSDIFFPAGGRAKSTIKNYWKGHDSVVNDLMNAQKEVCSLNGAKFFNSPQDKKVGIANNVRTGLLPLNGFRHPPENGTTGWFVYAGESIEPNDDFFVPLHVKHLKEWCPRVLRFLGLPPGWRFLVAHEYEDVWFDKSLLNLEP